jgi:hypothetical protein
MISLRLFLSKVFVCSIDIALSECYHVFFIGLFERGLGCFSCFENEKAFSD